MGFNAYNLADISWHSLLQRIKAAETALENIRQDVGAGNTQPVINDQSALSQSKPEHFALVP